MPADRIAYLPARRQLVGRRPDRPLRPRHRDLLLGRRGPPARRLQQGQRLRATGWRSGTTSSWSSTASTRRPSSSCPRRTSTRAWASSARSAVLQGKKSRLRDRGLRAHHRGHRGGRRLRATAPTPEKDKRVRIIADHVRSADLHPRRPQGRDAVQRRRGLRAPPPHPPRGAPRPQARHRGRLPRRSSPPWSSTTSRAPTPSSPRTAREILDELAKEEAKFLETLEKGEHEFEKMLPNLLKNPQKIMSGRLAFKLYDTYGFPIELTEELAAENGMTVNRAGVRRGLQEAPGALPRRARSSSSRAASPTSPRSRPSTTPPPTSCSRPSRIVLGDHVAQKGSNITAERMRFDFSHGAPMTTEELAEVEDIVNEQIARDLPVTMEIMKLDDGQGLGRHAPSSARSTRRRSRSTRSGDFSKEVCGGPHVERTGAPGQVPSSRRSSPRAPASAASGPCWSRR